MSEDVQVHTPVSASVLTWDHVVGDASVGLIDLDGHGTAPLMNDAARELLQLLRDGAADRHADPAPSERRRGPLSVRGDVTELLWDYAPAMAETIRREGRATGKSAPARGPAGPLAPSRVVSCPSSEGRRWVQIDGYRRSGNRFLVTLVDVTAVEQDRPADGALGWEIADTLAQRLVTAETALDLGRD